MEIEYFFNSDFVLSLPDSVFPFSLANPPNI